MLRFKVTLEVVTPIHIGNGEEYYPIEYSIKKEEKKLYVIDENKLLTNIEKEGKLEEFTKLSSNYTATNSALLEFIGKRAKNSYSYTVRIEDNAFDYINKEGAFRAPISRFIRNNFDNKVYIPGSTIKGAIRSAFIEMVMKRLESKYKTENRDEISFKFKKEFHSSLCSQIEAFLNLSNNPKDAKNDVMRFFKISDFICANAEEKVYKVFAIKRLYEDGTREVQNIPDILESTEKGSIFKGTIEIDNRLLVDMNKILQDKFGVKIISKISANNIAMWIRNFYRVQVYAIEKSAFQWDYPAKFFGAEEYAKYESIFREFGKTFDYPTEPKNEFIIKIGKHGGAISKTISGCRQIRVKGAEELQEHQTTLWLAGGLPMGWVKGTIEDAN